MDTDARETQQQIEQTLHSGMGINSRERNTAATDDRADIT
jgi:hypothetical protein